MTLSRAQLLPVVALAAFVAFIASACGSSTPCRNCPPLDGIYSVRWDADGGVNMNCPGPRLPSWTLAQRDTQITTTISGIPLGGTLYDSFDLLLTGGQTSLTYRLKAIAIPEGGAADAGMRLVGTFQTRTTPADGGDACESNEGFTAQRTSR